MVSIRFLSEVSYYRVLISLLICLALVTIVLLSSGIYLRVIWVSIDVLKKSPNRESEIL
jgi:hypothetical protein